MAADPFSALRDFMARKVDVKSGLAEGLDLVLQCERLVDKENVRTSANVTAAKTPLSVRKERSDESFVEASHLPRLLTAHSLSND